ncbi:MAG: imidazole glycerol phosphate synthase subunit HisH [Planctomycetota bacterium]
MTTLIVDYGMGNLRSVQKAFEHFHEPAEICSSPTALAQASRIVLPGVGAFRDAIAALHRHDLVNVLKDAIAADRPFLGICLGMQLLFSSSLEDGHHQGLDVIPGVVQRFQLPTEFKIPHMGWNQLRTAQVPPHPLFDNLPQNPWFYFVHSYHCVPSDNSWVAATTSYGPPFVASVARSNVMAVQFHPEKSQAAGLQLLRNFLSCTHTPNT